MAPRGQGRVALMAKPTSKHKPRPLRLLLPARAANEQNPRISALSPLMPQPGELIYLEFLWGRSICRY